MNSDQAREADDDGTESSVSRERSGQTETVASLVQRLGQPPSDLATHLSSQFATLCDHLAKTEPDRIPKTDLQSWCLDGDGALLAVDAITSFEDVELTNERPSIGTLVEAFRTNLNRPRASQSGTRPSLGASIADVSLSPEGDGEEQHSDAEQARRDKIAEMLTTSLIDRFGAEAVAAPVEEELAKKRTQPIQPDRRFNWNLVLGVGTAAAVVGMAYTGYRLTTIRETRAATEGERLERVVPTSNHGNSSGSGEDWKNPNVGDVEPLSPASTSVFAANKERTTPMDALETLESLDQKRTETAAKKQNDTFDVSVDPSSLLAIDLPSGVVLANGKGGTKDAPKPKPKQTSEQSESAAKTGTLEEVLTTSDSDVPESPQKIRAADIQFVALPRSRDPDQLADVPGVLTDFESIAFPIDVPIRLTRPQAGESPITLVSVRDKTDLAEFTSNDSGSRFAWTESAKSDSTASQVHHGKITKSDGGTIFMRPAIETDPMRLRLATRDAHPSWDLGWPILPKVSRLEFDIEAPEDVDYGWIETFDSSKPRRGRAIAMITPQDGESVAIAVQFNVRCASKLSCHLRYAARLDPSQPWQPLTKKGLVQISNAIMSQKNSMATRQQTFEQFYANADSVQRRLMRRKSEELDRAAEQIDATAKRIELLRSLAATVEERVSVSMRLFVQWPDGQQQTILRTTKPGE